MRDFDTVTEFAMHVGAAFTAFLLLIMVAATVVFIVSEVVNYFG